MSEHFEISAEIEAPPSAIYNAWMSSEGHAAMTGAEATVDARVGGSHSAWDGYIWGVTKELEPGRRIVQSWRTSEFSETDEDSLLELVLEPSGAGTRITLTHTNIPDGQGDSYKQGWTDHYFEPMRSYFGEA